MNMPVEHVSGPTRQVSPEQCDADARADGQAAGEDLLELLPVDQKHGEPGETVFAASQFTDDIRGPLERASTDPDFAAGMIETLGPEGYARLVAVADRIPLLDGLREGDNSQAATELLSLLGQSLGAATRSPCGSVDADFVAQVTRQDGYVTDDSLDPELAAILLNAGDYTPEAAAQLGAHVFLEGEPPRAHDREDGDLPTPAHRERLLTPAPHNVESDNIGAWATATHGILRNGASAELLAIRDGDGNPVVAERLLDPALADDPTVVMSPLTSAILDTPRQTLATQPRDSAALAAVESLVIATHAHNGRVGEWASQPLANLYMDYTGEILNIGEGRAAFPASASPLGERLAALPFELSGTGADVITAALGAGGTPPLRDPNPAGPFWPSAERYESWQDAVYAATDAYRGQVQDYGPPRDTDVQGTRYVDVDDLATEISDIDAELVQGQFGADAIAATDVDNDHQARQDAVNVITDYIGLGVGFGSGGAVRSTFATGYNTHAEAPLLEQLWPTDNARRVFQATVPEHARSLVAAQAVQIVEASARSGAVELPDSLRDPETGGLRTPTSDADGEQFARDLAAFIDGNDGLAQAVDGAASGLMERISALETGAYRGGS